MFIGECNASKVGEVLEVAFLLNSNFPVEANYSETIRELEDLAGPEFTISTGSTQFLELWLSYFESTEGDRREVEAKIQRAYDLAIRLAGTAMGIRHVPQIPLR